MSRVNPLGIKSSIIIALALALGFFFLSGGSIFISPQTVQSLSFSASSPENILFFPFAHTGILHLASNALAVIAFGLILEPVIGSLSLALLFIASTVVSAIAFAFINPGAGIAGASTGMSALAASAIALRPRKAITLAVCLVLFLNLAAFPFLESASEAQENGLGEKMVSLDSGISEAVSSENNSLAEKLSAEKALVQEELVTAADSAEFSESTPVNGLMHLFGALCGIAFVLVCRRAEVSESAKSFFHPWKK